MGGKKGKEGGKGGGGGGSVTLEKIRRVSSPLMTADIVFLKGGGGGQNGKAQQFVLCHWESFPCQVQVARLPHPAAAFCLATTKDRAVLADRQDVSTRHT